MIQKMPPRKHGGHNKGKHFSQTSKKIDQELQMITNLTGGQIPHGTLTQIAKINNVSREYVRQKANRLELISFHTITAKTKYCINCKKEFKPESLSKKYCSPECFKEYIKKKFWTTKKCKLCGKEKLYLKSKLKNRSSNYCSNTCWGKVMGKKYGKKALAEYRYFSFPSFSKTREELIKDLGVEFTIIDFARKYKITYSYAGNIIMDYQIKGLIKVKGKIGHRNIYKVL